MVWKLMPSHRLRMYQKEQDRFTAKRNSWL